MARREEQATAVKAPGTLPNEELPASSYWHLVSHNHEEPTEECRRRFGCRITDLQFHRATGVFAPTEENNTVKIHALILAPPGAPYESRARVRGTAHNQSLRTPCF
ncbi:hypothetical protein HPB50_011905 [Hyalomma asiaticum]|uniref:Uncharacterized protein n=1 Tax=Hyalomma asiaticum TaxID=266040 RepID=A0ACB7TIL0_HYAAI|nr:hypothetical protein HPB50_011905 [Hyalomma asiaticum]